LAGYVRWFSKLAAAIKADEAAPGIYAEFQERIYWR
jgi:hypothetical protein